MGDKIKWGVLGCAGIAKSRALPGFVLADNTELCAVASRTEEKAREMQAQFGAKKAYGSYEALLSDPEIEAVYIPLPNTLHKEWVFKAAEAGKHILCEKPLAITAAEAEEMFACCEENGVLLMEAFAYRHGPLVKKVKECIDAGTIGNVLYAESHITDVLRDMQNIRMNKDLGGGAFYDMSCYNINVISYLMGKDPVKVKALAQMNAEKGVDMANTIMIQYEDGTLAAAYGSLNSYTQGYYCVVGSEGRIEVHHSFNCKNVTGFTVATKGRHVNVDVLDEEVKKISVFCPDNYMLEFEQFGRCVRGLETPEVTKEETLRNARILDMARADLA